MNLIHVDVTLLKFLVQIYQEFWRNKDVDI
jgi:hypothetical protein